MASDREEAEYDLAWAFAQEAADRDAGLALLCVELLDDRNVLRCFLQPVTNVQPDAMAEDFNFPIDGAFDPLIDAVHVVTEDDRDLGDEPEFIWARQWISANRCILSQIDFDRPMPEIATEPHSLLIEPPLRKGCPLPRAVGRGDRVGTSGAAAGEQRVP